MSETKEEITSAGGHEGTDRRLTIKERAKKIVALWNKGKGLSTRAIATEVKCHPTTVERAIHNADLGETLNHTVRIKTKREDKKPKTTNSLGQSDSWENNLKIIKELLTDDIQSDLAEHFAVSRNMLSQICARAKKAGFNIKVDSEAVIKRKERNTFYKAAYMLFKGKTIRGIAKKLNVLEERLEELNILVQEILLS